MLRHPRILGSRVTSLHCLNILGIRASHPQVQHPLPVLAHLPECLAEARCLCFHDLHGLVHSAADRVGCIPVHSRPRYLGSRGAEHSQVHRLDHCFTTDGRLRGNR